MRASFVFAPLSLCLGLLCPVLSAAEITPAGRDYFEAHIRPVLVAECYECHAGENRKGGLVLDSRDALLKGGHTGPGLVPGDPSASLLIQSLAHTHQDVDLHMPKNGAKLDDVALKHFVEWVKMGAPDPRDKASASEGAQPVSWEQQFALRRQWWSLQPINRKAAPPASAAAAHKVDAFVQAKLEEHGLKAAKEADRRTLIRRLSYALTGLPPQPVEVEKFLADTSPDAWSKLVDYYLAQPAYGETWARHWMDLMRYAETHGSEGDPAIPDAWRYRDYLTRAFNADVPYDRFVKEHVAGDLLKPRWNEEMGINESLLATANLRLMEHGFQPIDALDEQVKTVDNQIDVLSKSFLGLTVSCARCHDHKFDAISQKDFFGLYGIFASTRPAQVVLDKPERLNVNRDQLLRVKGEIKKELVQLWLQSAEDLPARLMKGQLASVDTTTTGPEAALLELRSQARAQALAARGAPVQTKSVPQPFSCWSFEGDAKDSIGSLHGELIGGAVLKDGRLILDGKEAYVRTAPLTKTMGPRTLEAWVKLGTLEQRGGGVVTIENENGSIFDSIVFGEKRPGEWISGSNNHRRTKDSGGAMEVKGRDEFVHVAVVYAADHSVTMYRNGVMYGLPYVPTDELHHYLAGDGHILLGKRHLGGGNSMLTGEIEEARLYDRALNADEVAASFQAGTVSVNDRELLAAMSGEQRARYDVLNQAIRTAEAAAKADPVAQNWKEALAGATKNRSDPLVAWVNFKGRSGNAFAKAWEDFATGWQQELAGRKVFNAENFTPLWDLTNGADYKKWFKEGNGLPLQPAGAGEFVVEPLGPAVVRNVLPAGVYSPLLSAKQAALLTSPFFDMNADAVSVQLTGDDGGGIRIMVDNYPLGNNDTYPQFRPAGDALKWIKLDTTYRKGSRAYVELATRDDSTRPQGPSAKPVIKGAKPGQYEGRSWFGLGKVVLHKGSASAPKEELVPVTWLLAQGTPKDAATLANQLRRALVTAIQAWEQGSLTAEQQVYLDFFVSRGLLPVHEGASEKLAALTQTYRKLEAAVPLPRRAPGPVEGNGYETALMVRGDHLKPGDEVPRAFLSVFGGADCRDAGSGRLKLAEAMTADSNPLLARVMVNRIWHWLFGKGLVGTVDNFGRLGDKPSHPELLDYLATRFEEDGWSVKGMIRFLVTSDTWRQSSETAPETARLDVANQWFSRARVQRLEAEMIRDAMLRVSGALKEDLYGEPVGDAQRRRSLYLRERRTAPQAFLEVFDRPKPMTTRGQRDATNIPAQSLTMMNDRFVIELAGQWAKKMLLPESGADVYARVRRVYEAALSREPTNEEMEVAREYLGEGMSEEVWRDYLQAVFGLKEFIYLR